MFSSLELFCDNKMNKLCGFLFITFCIIYGTCAYPQNFARYPTERKSYEAEPELYQPTTVLNKTLIENETYMYGGRQVSLIQKEVDTSFVFPGDLDTNRQTVQFKQKFGKRGPACAKGYTFCEDVDVYPLDHIKNIKKQAMQFSALFGIDEMDTQITQRIDAETRELCDSIQHIVYPKMAKNKDKDWLFIMNDDKEQGIRVEQCKTTGPCQFVDRITGYSSQCEQKYIYRKMLAVDNVGNPQPDYFPMPSCCACKLKLQGFVENAPPMTPAKRRRRTPSKNLDRNVLY